MRRVIWALGELRAVLRDAWEAADLRGRLAAWLEVVRGRVVVA